ncbi:hypothetical protein FSCG_01292 [Fusobacterium vincentii 4_1_13]|uniref:Uncharacterized protein n=2 Tax=Fusobacterium vincentii TaxID=155615 RepID=A0ABV3Y7C6_FUSVC|nr:hypothetical protein [Fusobacterium vincentii]EEO40579.1 hypothetical protein FSCG_01292 [Fusobacterium vincentii 4_1_13]
MQEKDKNSLSEEIKEIIKKYEDMAKEQHQSFTNFISENNILYVLVWDDIIEDKYSPLFIPIFDLEKRREVPVEDIGKDPRLEVTDRVVFMQKLFIKFAKENSKI